MSIRGMTTRIKAAERRLERLADTTGDGRVVIYEYCTETTSYDEAGTIVPTPPDAIRLRWPEALDAQVIVYLPEKGAVDES